MKNMFFGVFAIVVVFFVFSLKAADNLLPNPQFASSNGKSPDGWYAHQVPRKLLNFSVADGVAKIGQKSESVINQLIVSVQVGKAKKLRAGIEYRLDELKSPGGMLYHFVDISGKKKLKETAWTGLKTKIASSEWQKFFCEIPVPEGASAICVVLAVYGKSDYPEGSMQFRKPVLEIIE